MLSILLQVGVIVWTNDRTRWDASSSKLAMASCLTNDSACFGLHSLESANNCVLSSVSFQQALPLSSSNTDSPAVSNLCAQVVLTGASDMQSTKKTSKMVENSKTKRLGRRSHLSSAVSLEKKSEEVENISDAPTVSKIITRRSAEKLERVTSDGANSADVCTTKRRGRKRSTEFCDRELDSSSSKQLNSADKPEKKRKLRSDKTEEMPAKVPGTAYKICDNCGTVADKSKAKKCRQCKKFFFNHWAKRCRIPPCPKCHFSRKAKPQERVPPVCEQCGFQLPLDAEEEGGVCKTESSSADLDSSVSSKTKEDEDGSDRARRDSKSDELSLTSTVSTPLVSPDNLGSFKVLEELNKLMISGSPELAGSSKVPLKDKLEYIAQDEQIQEDNGIASNDPTQVSLDFTDMEDISQHEGIIKGNQSESQSISGLQETLEKATQDVQDVFGVIEGKHSTLTTGQSAVTEELEATRQEVIGAEKSSTSDTVAANELTDCAEFSNPAEEHRKAESVPLVSMKYPSLLAEVPAGNPKLLQVGHEELMEQERPKSVAGKEKQNYPENELFTTICKPIPSHSFNTINCTTTTTTTASHNFSIPPALTVYGSTSSHISGGRPITSTSIAIPPVSLSGLNSTESHSRSNRALVASSGSPQTIDRSLKEHFERSLGLKGEKVQADMKCPSFDTDSLAMSGENSYRTVAIAEDKKIEMSTVMTVDQLSTNVWSSSSDTTDKRPASASICTMEKPSSTSSNILTSKQLPKFSTSDFGNVNLRSSMNYLNYQHNTGPSALDLVCQTVPISASSPPSPPFGLLHVSSLTSSSSVFPFHPASISLGSTTHKLLQHQPPTNTGLDAIQPTGAYSSVGSTRVTLGTSISSISMSTPSGTMSSIMSGLSHSTCTLVPSASTVRPSFTTVGPSIVTVEPSVGSIGSTIAPLIGMSSQGTAVMSQATITPSQVPIAIEGKLPQSVGLTQSSILPDEFRDDKQAIPALKHNLSQIIPKLDSKTLSSTMNQPPSLISIGASGTVTITRSYTFPQAPRVSVAVAPPPLQNFKESVLTRSTPSSLQSLIPSIGAHKMDTSVRPALNASDGGLAGRTSNLPPPLLSACSLAELSANARTVGIEQRFTSTRPVTVNIVSSANPQSIFQHGQVSSGDPQLQKSSVMQAVVSHVSSVSERVQFPISSERINTEGTQKRSNCQPPRIDGVGERVEERGEVSASVLGNVRAEVLSPSPTSFQKLDILRSPNAANKIRVTLLKDNLNGDSTVVANDQVPPPPVSSPTPPSPLFPPSSTRLITKVYEFPRHLAGSTVSASVPSSFSAPSHLPLTTCGHSSSNLPTSLACVPVINPTSNSIQVIPTPVATLPPVTIGRGVTAAVIRRSMSPQGAATPQSSAFKWPIQTSSLPSFDKISRDSSSLVKGAPKIQDNKDEKRVSSEECEEGSARTSGVGLRWRQHRNSSGLDPQIAKFHNTDIYSNKAVSDEQDSDNNSRKTSYRKILPNTLKQGSSVTSSAALQRATSPTHSHVRTGVVTVQVCSNIPATLSLSSIITPKITQAEAAESSLGDKCNSVFSSTESYGHSDTMSSSQALKKSVISGGGGVMVTPLSPSILPPSRTVAQIVTNSISSKDVSWHFVGVTVLM